MLESQGTNGSGPDKLPLAKVLAMLAVFVLGAERARCDVKMAYFMDNMVLQRDMVVPVWGKADPGEAVTVGFHGQSKSATADDKGNWKVKLDPMPAGGPFDMTLQGKNALKFGNVMVGEVWLCGGQSNMAFKAPVATGFTADSVKSANYPDIRQLDTSGRVWRPCSPATIAYFTAVGFFMARELQKNLNVPIGLLHLSQGGTGIERWMVPGNSSAVSDLYLKFIAPVAGWAIRGTLWYQGEQNGSHGEAYMNQFPALIRGWRKAWGQGDFPFIWIQLPNYKSLQSVPDEPASAGDWQVLREAQRLALSLPHTGMVVTIDLGDSANVHPHNKIPVGQRAALVARSVAYGQNLVYSGPMYESMKVEGNRIRLSFNHVGGGLVAKGSPAGPGGGPVKGFVIAGADNVFQFADAAEIQGSEVVVSSAKVAAPTQVRYAWAMNPACNLYNVEGLPASPFRTTGPQLPVALTRRVGPGRAAVAKPVLAIPAAPQSDALGRIRPAVQRRRKTSDDPVRLYRH